MNRGWQCDKEELERFAVETGLSEKGKVYVKGLFEESPRVKPKGFGSTPPTSEKEEEGVKP